jgi:hypothetical protein
VGTTEDRQMDDVKRTTREVEETSKEAWRKADGEEDLADKAGNLGDDIRKEAGNAGDAVTPDTDYENRPVDQPR